MNLNKQHTMVRSQIPALIKKKVIKMNDWHISQKEDPG